MKPLIVLLIAFLMSLVALQIFTGTWNFSFAGCIAMSAMLVLPALAILLLPKAWR